MLLTLSILVAPLIAQEAATSQASWPSFRGEEGNGHVAPHPSSWSDGENLAWKVNVPGGGWSSPVVAGDRVFLTTAIQTAKEDGGRPLGFAGGVRMPASRGAGAERPEGEVVFQLRAYAISDGSLVFEKELAKRVPAFGIHPSNTFATESPATDGERVVCYFGAIGLVACLDLDGRLLWSRDVGTHPTNADFGTGSSVAIAEGNAFVQCDNEEASFVAAFRLEDGEPAWRAERPKGTAWASPVLWKRGDLRDLVVCGPGAVTGYSPTSGVVRWRLSGIGGTFSASPAVAGDRLILGNSARMRRGPLAALSEDVEGEIDLAGDEASALLWSVDRAGPGFSSPVAANGLVWVISSQGILTCRDADTGDEVYDERLADVRNVVSCPWTDGLHLYILAEGGTTYAVKAGREFEVVSASSLDGTFWSTPSAAGGSLLLRSADTLFCVREREAD